MCNNVQCSAFSDYVIINEEEKTKNTIYIKFIHSSVCGECGGSKFMSLYFCWISIFDALFFFFNSFIRFYLFMKRNCSLFCFGTQSYNHFSFYCASCIMFDCGTCSHMFEILMEKDSRLEVVILIVCCTDRLFSYVWLNKFGQSRHIKY